MKVQEEVKKEVKVNEDSLTDLPMAEDKAANTKGGGKDHADWIMIESVGGIVRKAGGGS